MSNKRSRLSTKCTVLLGALAAVAILTGLGAAAYAQDGGTTSRILPPERTVIFDPFTLSIIVPAESGSGSPDVGLPLAVRPSIRIPARPGYRTSFRPPLSLR